MLSNGLAPWHLLLLVLVAVVVFGSSRLPGAARGLGQALRILKSEVGATKSQPDTAASRPAEEQQLKPPPAGESAAR
ncbi:twin-arginine translocase TatA/TatE family subunit [Streptomyces sp. P38-E01]|uniref:Sec-independent protein translocase protein TatA n=1 Tax=Streptomyces tardus TaxID=2780544 RepID=A0A949JM85_9ACTN|nr:twin-arginine translocase TatA/TatE family subunit [Streptomyces tardus]MBU7597706.1 twin-arginine translocase TatA/TatE family subunit [Streptomyces tardus]